MRPVKQTRLHKGLYPISDRGNCFPACIASILEMECEDVIQIQEYYDDNNWNKILFDWLYERGYLWRSATIEEIRSKDAYILVTGGSTRYPDLTHITIWQDGKMVHDPHPDNSGITDQRCFEVIVPIYPLKAVQKCPRIGITI